MNRLPKQEEIRLEKQMEQHVIDTYKQLVTSRYYTKSQIEQIVLATKKVLPSDELERMKQILVQVKGVLALAVRANTYDAYERRFSQYFHSLLEEVAALIKKMDNQSNEYQKLLRRILFYFVYDAYEERSPWPYLVLKIADHVPVRQLEVMDQFLEESLSDTGYARKVSIAKSYLLLKVGKERKALSYLMRIVPIGQQEVTVHFQCLKKRERWQTIQEWFAQLFPNRSERGYGSLQQIADEMHASLHQSANVLTGVWKRWLLQPSFQRFLSLLTHVPADERDALVDQLLHELKQSLHQTETVITYIRMLKEYEKYEEASAFFLIHEHDPLRLHQEKKDLLKRIEQHKPSLAKPIHHQFVIRLVEKKSRVHYEAAVGSIRTLQELYLKTDERTLFFHYLARMKKQYRTYRAFVEELKTIE
ncbi:hypothetical protein [Bacillus sp. FJAT-45037]|uniref:hypothetical protein n=1 Tax=Bacillus sp. FJAT-45037 TaxID=2011007 RepID=UPI000C23CC42|nr:hypothetical protein [Bacillus sp. FJAT-45037]